MIFKERLFLIIMMTASIFFTACNRHRLGVSEKELAKELVKEGIKNDKSSKTNSTFSNGKPGVKYEEVRGIDPNSPPIVIDLIHNREKAGKVKLSSLFSRIETIQLEPDYDTLNVESNSTGKGSNSGKGNTYVNSRDKLNEVEKEYLIGEDHIYSSSLLNGIKQYTRDGRFSRNICNNNTPFQIIGNKMLAYNSEDFNNQFSGARHVYMSNDKLMYQHEDRPENKYSLMEIDDKEPAPIMMRNQINNEQKKSFKAEGIKRVDFGAAPKQPFSSLVNFLLNGNVISSFYEHKSPGKVKHLMQLLSATGDTLCIFKDFDQPLNSTKTTYRSFDNTKGYMLGGNLYIRPAYNDTIFKLVPPNKLFAKYILNFGEKGIANSTEALNPDKDLSDKLLIQSVLESDKYIFISYTGDYLCLNTIKKRTLKYNRVIYNKITGKIITVYLNEESPEKDVSKAPEKNIENDLNHLPFFWPKGVTSDGKPFAVLNSYDLTNYLKANGKLLPDMKMKDRAVVIMIYY